MADKQFEIFIAYLMYLSRQMDIVFSAACLAGLSQTNDFKIRATIKEMEKTYKLSFQELQVNLENIMHPENAGNPEGAREKVHEVTGQKPKAS